MTQITKSLFVILLAMGMLSLAACTGNKDLFDQTEYTETLQSSFPVKNIDASQTWATEGTVTANVAVNEGDTKSYTIKFYDAVPFNNDSTVLLATQNVVGGQTLTCKVDYPLSTNVLYIAAIDENNRVEVIPSAIKNNTVTAVFGTNNAVSKASATSRATTRTTADEYPITAINRPYTDTQIDDMLAKADEVSSITKGDIGNNGTNASHYYKISDTFNGNIVDNSPAAGSKLIVSGIWNVKSNFAIQGGLEIIVANGGAINIPSGVSLVSNSKDGLLTVLNGGKIEGAGTINFDSGGSIYNGGSLKCKLIQYDSKGSLYNAAGADLQPQTITLNSGATFTNFGSCKVTGDITNPAQTSSVFNACMLKVNGILNTGHLIIGSSASVECKELDLYSDAKLNANAYLYVSNTSNFYNATVTGPTDGSNYAICDFAKAYAQWSSVLYLSNFLYVTYSKFNYAGNTHLQFSNNVTVVDKGYAKLNIDASDCTIGYTSKSTDVARTDGNDFTTSYCFEDNYPVPGDYDFNDVVMDVARTLKNNVVTLKVTLRAIGASKELGGAIRLDGITASQITGVTTDNAFHASLGNGLMEEATTNGYSVSTDSKGSVIIPLYGDAHKALTGSTARVFYNTSNTGKTASAITLTITINAASYDAATLINYSSIDPFINNGAYEIHTYPWKDNAALTKTATADTDNYIWAIAVPNFKYPLEGNSITSAYPDFEKWAQDHTTHTDWYKSPAASYVY
jgi:LruC domain-containing protein